KKATAEKASAPKPSARAPSTPGSAPARRAPSARRSTAKQAAASTASAKKSPTLASLKAPAAPRRVGARYLVVVESPAKAKTIKKYLGAGYSVKASVGHIKDLPKSRMGVDVEHGFKPEYVVIKSKEKALGELKKFAL